MGRINWTRVILGGLLAGLIMNLSGILLVHLVLGEPYVDAFRARVTPQPEGLMFAKHAGLRLWYGLIAVFIYAGFRPRFGPGPRTAALAGATVFLGTGLALLLSLNDFGLLSGWQLWASAAWALGEAVIATLAGAWLYRERDAPRT